MNFSLKTIIKSVYIVFIREYRVSFTLIALAHFLWTVEGDANIATHSRSLIHKATTNIVQLKTQKPHTLMHTHRFHIQFISVSFRSVLKVQTNR